MTNAIRFAVLSLMTSAAVSANPPTLNAPPSVAAYLDQVAAVETAGPRVSLEPVYNAALAAQDDLMTLRDDAAWIEGLSDADFAVLQSRLRGFALSRGLEIYADPDPAFFRALADKHGQPADQAFFAQLEQSTAPDYLPVYLRPEGLSVLPMAAAARRCFASVELTVDEARAVLAQNPAQLMTGFWLGQTPPPEWWWREDASGGQVVEQALEVLEPGPDAWGYFFAEAAQGGLRDDLGRDLERERQAREQVERIRQQELVKEREAHARRDDELDHGL